MSSSHDTQVRQVQEEWDHRTVHLAPRLWTTSHNPSDDPTWPLQVTWPSHDHHMTIMYSLVPSISHLCFLIAYSTCTVIKNWSVHTASKPRMTVTWHIASHMTITWPSHDTLQVTWPSHDTLQVTWLSHDHHIPLHTTEPQQRWGEPCVFSHGIMT